MVLDIDIILQNETFEEVHYSHNNLRQMHFMVDKIERSFLDIWIVFVII